jgi:hypothetical protein
MERCGTTERLMHAQYRLWSIPYPSSRTLRHNKGRIRAVADWRYDREIQECRSSIRRPFR